VERVRKDLAAIETEATDENPDPPAMRDTILRVIRRVGLVEPVLSAANNLRELVESLIGH
jgi:hypothetical protein